jgi:hypothetical protein
MAETSSHERWLARVRQMPPAQRIAAIERKLRTLPKTPTAANVYFRKALLRLRDASRLEAGLVSAAALQRENSPFTAADFRAARIVFRPRFSGKRGPKVSRKSRRASGKNGRSNARQRARGALLSCH